VSVLIWWTGSCKDKKTWWTGSCKDKKTEKTQLTVTVRTTPPLAPSRAIARETAFITNCCEKIIKCINPKAMNGIIITTNTLIKKSIKMQVLAQRRWQKNKKTKKEVLGEKSHQRQLLSHLNRFSMRLGKNHTEMRTCFYYPKI